MVNDVDTLLEHWSGFYHDSLAMLGIYFPARAGGGVGCPFCKGERAEDDDAREIYAVAAGIEYGDSVALGAIMTGPSAAHDCSSRLICLAVDTATMRVAPVE